MAEIVSNQEPFSHRVPPAVDENGSESSALSGKQVSPHFSLIGSFCALVCRVLALLVGGVLIAAAIGWEPGRIALSPLAVFETWWPVAGCLAGGVFLMAAALAPWIAPRFIEEEEELLFIQTAHGSVCLPTRTITDFLKREGSRIPGVVSLKANLIRQDGEIAVEVEASLVAESAIPEMAERIQAFVKKELGGTIGIRNVQTVHVHVRDLAPDVRPVVLSPFLARDPKPRSLESDRPTQG